MKAIETKISEKTFMSRLFQMCEPHDTFTRGYESRDCFTVKKCRSGFRISLHAKNIWNHDRCYSEAIYGKYCADNKIRYRFAKPIASLAPGLIVSVMAIPIFVCLIRDAVVNSYFQWGAMAVMSAFLALGIYLIFGYSRKYRRMLTDHLNKICKTRVR